MQKWEYLILKRNTTPEGVFKNNVEWEPDPDLNALGEDSWELINLVPSSDVHGEGWSGMTTQIKYYFKRPKE